MLRAVSYFLVGATVAFAVVVVATGTPLPQVSVEMPDADTPTPAADDGDVAVAGNVETTTPTTPADAGTNIDPKTLEWEIHKQVNDIRTTSGLDRLKMLPDLRTAARRHSRDMASNGFVGHEGSDGSTFEDRYAAVNFRCGVEAEQPGEYLKGAENVAYRSTTTTNETRIAERIVGQWMNSEGHRENILMDPWYREGIGVAVTSTGEVYATQNFC